MVFTYYHRTNQHAMPVRTARLCVIDPCPYIGSALLAGTDNSGRLSSLHVPVVYASHVYLGGGQLVTARICE